MHSDLMSPLRGFYIETIYFTINIKSRWDYSTSIKSKILQRSIIFIEINNHHKIAPAERQSLLHFNFVAAVILLF